LLVYFSGPILDLGASVWWGGFFFSVRRFILWSFSIFVRMGFCELCFFVGLAGFPMGCLWFVWALSVFFFLLGNCFDSRVVYLGSFMCRCMGCWSDLSVVL